MPKRECNRHEDCDAADEKAKDRAKERKLPPYHWMHRGAEHCHDEDCEDCFGT